MPTAATATMPATMGVDAAVERLQRPVGDPAEDRLAAQNPPRPADEQTQQRKLAARQRNRLARLAGKRAGVEIENEAGKAEALLGLARVCFVRRCHFSGNPALLRPLTMRRCCALKGRIVAPVDGSPSLHGKAGIGLWQFAAPPS